MVPHCLIRKQARLAASSTWDTTLAPRCLARKQTRLAASWTVVPQLGMASLAVSPAGRRNLLHPGLVVPRLDMASLAASPASTRCWLDLGRPSPNCTGTRMREQLMTRVHGLQADNNLWTRAPLVNSRLHATARTATPEHALLVSLASRSLCCTIRQCLGIQTLMH